MAHVRGPLGDLEPGGHVPNETISPEATKPEVVYLSDSTTSPSPLSNAWRSIPAQPSSEIAFGRSHFQPAQTLTWPDPQEALVLPSTSSPFPGFTRAITQDNSAFSSTITPSPSFDRDMTPRAFELPRILEIGGFTYQRTDLAAIEPSTTIWGGHMGGLPFHQQNQNYPLPLARGSSQVVFPEIRRDQIDEAAQVQQAPDPQSTSEPHSDTATSTRMRLTGADFRESITLNSRRKSKISRTTKGKKPSKLEQEAASKKFRPVTRGLSPLASLKRKRCSKTVPKHRDVIESTELEPDAEQERTRRKMTRSPKSVSVKPRRKSNMLLEIQAHNQSPEPKSKPDREILNKIQDSSLTRTRSERQALLNFLQNEARAPRKNLNLKKLMLNQLGVKARGGKPSFGQKSNSNSLGRISKQWQQESKGQEDIWNEDDDETDDFREESKTNDQSYGQLTSVCRVIPRQVKGSGANIQREKEMADKSDWSVWDSMKVEINELIRSPRCSSHYSQKGVGPQGRKKLVSSVATESPRSYLGACRVEDGLHVFSPTSAAFLDFDHLLMDIEEAAGRKMGVVKVIVPSNCLSGVSTADRSMLSGISTPNRSMLSGSTTVSMKLNKGAAKESIQVYNVLMANDSTFLRADEVLEKIQQDQEKVIKRRSKRSEVSSRNDIWKKSHAQKPYSERKMIRHSKKSEGTVVSAPEPATSTLRMALGCRNPNIDSLPGNRFTSPGSTQAGAPNQSIFFVATGPGPLSPLRMDEYAAYSINYHHSGAARMLTVTAPEDHHKLEELVNIIQKPGNLLIRSAAPPTCSQFVAHQPIYLPRATMSSYNVNYTEVVQHPGEMVIIFPYAYHEAYTSGPNITEEILYANDRSEVFQQEDLYWQCNPNCAAGQHL